MNKLNAAIECVNLLDRIAYRTEDLTNYYRDWVISNQLYFTAVERIYILLKNKLGINFDSSKYEYHPDSFRITYMNEEIEEESLDPLTACIDGYDSSAGHGLIAPFFSLSTYTSTFADLCTYSPKDLVEYFCSKYDYDSNLEHILTGNIFRKFSLYLRECALLVKDQEWFINSMSCYIQDNTSYSEKEVKDIMENIFQDPLDLVLPVTQEDIEDLYNEDKKSNNIKEIMNDFLFLLLGGELTLLEIPYLMERFHKTEWFRNDEEEFLQLELYKFSSSAWYKYKKVPEDFRIKHCELCNALDRCLWHLENGCCDSLHNTCLDGIYVNDLTGTVDICLAIGYEFDYDSTYGYEKIRLSFSAAAIISDPLLQEFEKLYELEYGKKGEE